MADRNVVAHMGAIHEPSVLAFLFALFLLGKLMYFLDGTAVILKTCPAQH